jgi:hypothetical protein
MFVVVTVLAKLLGGRRMPQRDIGSGDYDSKYRRSTPDSHSSRFKNPAFAPDALPFRVL